MFMARLAHGEVVPRPRKPVELSNLNPCTPELPNQIVVEAWRPLVSNIAVPVELTVPPKLVVGVNGKAKVSKSDPATAAMTCPPTVVLRSDPEVIPEIQRLVDEALAAEIIVVEA